MQAQSTDNHLIARLKQLLVLYYRFPEPPSKAAEEQSTNRKKEVGKGNRRMPWLSKAKKDAISCDKRGGGADDP